MIVSSGVLTREKIGNPRNCFGVRDLPSPSRHPNQNGPSEYRHDGASHRVPDSNVERIIRGTGEDEDECSPGCGRKRRGKRRPSAVGGRSTSYQYAKCDSWWNRQYHHFPHALHALRPIETAKQICPPVAGRINQPAAGEYRDDAQENPTQTTTGRSNGIARSGSRRPHRGQQ